MENLEGGQGFFGGFSSGSWATSTSTMSAAANGLSMAVGSRDSLFSAPRAPEMVSDRYIKQNKIDAHAFKRTAGNVRANQLSRYNIFKDKAKHNQLWIGTNNPKSRDWRMTQYCLEDLLRFWRK